MQDRTPRRIQRSRAKGWRMPEGAVYVGRPGPFGNPWRISTARDAGFGGTNADLANLCVNLFRTAMRARLPAVAVHTARLRELRGKALICWCAVGSPCHADVLLALAND